MSNDFKDLFGEWNPEEDRSRLSDGPLPEPENRRPRQISVKEVRVVNVYEAVQESVGGIVPPVAQIFVLMRDNAGREFRIFIMRDVAMSISMALAGGNASRPVTHDLMKTLLDRLGGTVERITIDDLWQDTYYARVSVLKGENEYMDIDARPSDAIALALRCKAPIYVAESVLEAAQNESP